MAQADYQRDYYKTNREWIQKKRKAYREKNKLLTDEQRNAAVKRHQKHTKEFIQSFKNKPCLDCGVTYPSYVLDFDHRDPSTKKFSISSMVNLNHDDIVAEIEKCDLVCANCHRERTYGGRK